MTFKKEEFEVFQYIIKQFVEGRCGVILKNMEGMVCNRVDLIENIQTDMNDERAYQAINKIINGLILKNVLKITCTCDRDHAFDRIKIA